MKNMFRKIMMMCCLSMLMTGVLAGNNKKMNEQVLNVFINGKNTVSVYNIN